MKDLAAAATSRIIPVAKVYENMHWDVPVSATPTSLTVGAKVTLHTDGAQVTATTTSGVATIVSLNGATAVGDIITVRF